MAGVRQALATGVYRLAARVTAGLLRGHQIVESIYLRRSVAVGEVSFSRSDIDLLIGVRRPDPASGDGPELASLYRGVSFLRRFNPALSHIQMHDACGLERWIRTDTCRGSGD